MDDPKWLTDPQLEAWRLFSAVINLLPRELEASLEPYGVSYFEYQVMAGLSDAPDHTLPMSRLADWSNGSLSRLSHVVSRMEQRGLVRRSRCPDDGRVTLAHLTEQGHALMRRAAPDHVASVREALIDRLDDDQVDQLAAICRQALDGMGLVYPPPWEADPDRRDGGDGVTKR